MEIIIYTSTGCFYCVQVKKLCKRAELEYKEIAVGIDIKQEELLELYPDCKGYPYVIIDGEPIGGLVETAKKFVKEGLVSSGKR
tara:strand:- start:1772 stop:2023 length:252 start_codon:yes stop_codon:yes gene_type:complete